MQTQRTSFRGASLAVALILLLAGLGLFQTAPVASGAENKAKPLAKNAKVIFLHHSTGGCVWDGGVAEWFEKYNAAKGTSYKIAEQEFPKDAPYGWENYPFDYWNIWVKHGGEKPYKKEPTLEMLTQKHDVIVFKHCFPVCDIEPDTGNPDIGSREKRIENYKLQYAALKKKLHGFPRNRFILWTGAAQVANATTEENAKRARAFFDWVRKEWDKPGDNIYLWDFYGLETEGGLYLKNKYAASPDDSHPNETFSKKVAPLFGQRIIRVMEGKGDG